MPNNHKKTPEEMDAERQQAQEQLKHILDTSRPKNIQQGVGQGVGNILSGAIGAVGIAVLAPTFGLAVGVKHGGVLGGLFGLLGGVFVGIVGGTIMALGGLVTGVVQIGRGVAAVPQQIIAPRQGKWWNEIEGHWVETFASKEAKSLEGIDPEDRDILGGIQKDLDNKSEVFGPNHGKVKDPFYYEALEVPTDADASTIKRRYYLLARKYHPDKAGRDDAEAAEKFKVVAEAYQVLSDPELRKKYDKEGKGGLSADKTTVADIGMPKVDPAILFAYLFGSDKFSDYIGRLATATSASVGDSPKVSYKEARTLQKRRVGRLMLKLIDKIEPWVEYVKGNGGELTSPPPVEEQWKEEMIELSKASFGHQLITTIGKAYNLVAVMYEGTTESGQGLPSISQWAGRQKALMESRKDKGMNKREQLKAGLSMMKLQNELTSKLNETKTDEERERVVKEMEGHAVDILLRVLWTTTVVDITSTIFEVTQMVFFDKDVDKDTHKYRAWAVKALGSLWMDCPEPAAGSGGEDGKEKDAKQLYEEAAFAAMLETVKRKDEEQFRASKISFRK